MLKEGIDIRCPSCGARMSLAWPTSRKRRARVKCSGCGKEFPLAEAVERSVVGAPDQRDLHLVPKG